jgi:hypothetical protein
MKRGGVAVALSAWALLAYPGGPDEARAEKKAEHMQASFEDLFDEALVAQGTIYLSCEQKLRDLIRANQQNLAEAKKHLADAEPIAALLASVLLDWNKKSATEFSVALDYLDRVGPKVRRTAIGYPPPLGIADYLKSHFADRVAQLLALRLTKQDDWPPWRISGIVFYLGSCRMPATTAALLRFAMEARLPQWRADAVEAIKEIGDKDLAAKLAVEKARARSMGRAVPPELTSL